MSDRIFDVGGTVITGTATVTGHWRRLAALTDTVLAAGTTARDLEGTLNGLPLTAGTELIGSFTAIQLVSGNAVAYF